MARPGIMLYFEIRQPLKVLPDADKGRLLDAILEYGEHGTIPKFDGEMDAMLAMAWGFIQPDLDRDSKAYEKTVLKRQYATFCRELKRKGLPDVSFDDWMEMSDDEKQQMVSHDITRYPTTTTTSTGTTTPITTGTTTGTPTPTTKSTASTTAAAAGNGTGTPTAGGDDLTAATEDRKLKIFNGKLGKGVVVLSDYQIDILIDKMGLDMFDHYVEKLATWIMDNGATVKSHYSTILKWWTEDCLC